ncbi:glycosyltransferase family 2 protein [Tellurirhabdus rosea]|uniref:glycosyltransferase family 2 protein n=1 Tax=Tellurirhabdus rosea TaxID=2674997 RepID=UPI00225A43A4|nr:glycosyltransferase family 2 protein [Tellurirhabdus rosea]
MTEPLQPLISVIIGFYNEEKFLNEAIESVLAQDYANWEIVLVDDGSTDGSTAQAKAWADRFPDRIRYFEHAQHANRGAAASRNVAFRAARGEFVAILDADDVWLPVKMTRQLAIMHQHPNVALLCEASESWYDWAANPPRKNVIIPVGVAGERVYAPPQLLHELYPLGKGAAPCPSGILLRKSLFGETPFDESFTGLYGLYEDQAFLCKIYLHSAVYVSSACHNRYRQWAGSISAAVQQKGRYAEVRLFFLHWLKRYLTENGITDERIWRDLHKAFWPYRFPVLHRISSTMQRRLRRYLHRAVTLVMKPL